MSDLNSLTVLVAGATSTSGEVMARALTGAGARVVAVGRSDDKLAALREAVPGTVTFTADLASEDDVASLTERVHAKVGPIDGLVHLVGGWRGGGGLAGQSEADYRFLENSFTALRFVSRAFDADLQASSRGRVAVVSSTALRRPLAGGANYAAVKAATEAWTRALAHGFTKAARDEGCDLSGAAVIYRVKGLDGLEESLADAVVTAFAGDAADVNDQIIDLTGSQA
ncbi:SDR family NAD(P)-dependent oxidoreductase [Dermacoccus barathri]|uniref:SDR family NAD(P)-dependent oxidoreductase n=1 Tax=Dermacoccus barathri TaxID=322601 RepID=UPI00187A70DA|nr:SDR family NAD(P)-dependent oxidoreductase [Dermacoccus barathri]MBE7371103.1 SDR family NAD(P)-dependent oxidoreductase [Dermacoccus barathri]